MTENRVRLIIHLVLKIEHTKIRILKRNHEKRVGFFSAIAKSSVFLLSF